MVGRPMSTGTTQPGEPLSPLSPLGQSTLEPLSQPQLYELIAARLVEWITSGRLRDGDRLPPERELAVRLEVSRSSVREAIGALKLEGLVETRPGSGSFVAAGAQERAVALGSRPAGTAPGDDPDAGPFALLQAREALEPGIARIAAERATGSARAEELLAAMDSVDIEDPLQRDRWSDADRLFHRELAVLSGNPVLIGLAAHVAALMDQPLWRRLRDDNMLAVRGRVVVYAAEHRLIYQAVLDGEPEIAAAAALQHIRRVRRQMDA